MRKLMMLAMVVLISCKPKKVPAFIHYDNTCQNEWVEYQDGSWDAIGEYGVKMRPLTVPCTVQFVLEEGYRFYKVPYPKKSK